MNRFSFLATFLLCTAALVVAQEDKPSAGVLPPGVSKIDAYGLYLAYHEGPRGFSRGTHNQKRWLLNAAHRVESRTRRYTQQYAGCKERLDRPWWRRLF